MKLLELQKSLVVGASIEDFLYFYDVSELLSDADAVIEVCDTSEQRFRPHCYVYNFDWRKRYWLRQFFTYTQKVKWINFHEQHTNNLM